MGHLPIPIEYPANQLLNIAMLDDTRHNLIEFMRYCDNLEMVYC